MKKIIYFLSILFITTLSSNAQSRYDIANLTPFVGNWEWVNGNETFKVEIYLSETNYLEGHYKLVQTDNTGTETTIYKSNKVIDPNTGFRFGPAIFGGSLDGIKFGALIADNVLTGDGIHSRKRGSLGFTIQPISIGPITATWKVTILMGMKSSDTPTEFTIPTDIVLTKVD